MIEQEPTNETPAEQTEPVEANPIANQEAADSVETVAQPEPMSEQEPVADSEPPASAPPAAWDATTQEAQADTEQPEQPKVRRRQSVSRRPKRNPALVAGYFTACPRCSYFLAGYRLIYQDFNEAAADAAGDWVDLSWNLAVRNLVTKSFGYELAEPLEAMQGVCPSCRRAFIFQAADDEEAIDRFSIQINPRS